MRGFTSSVSASLLTEQTAKNSWLFGICAFMRIILEGVSKLLGQLLIEHLRAPAVFSLQDRMLKRPARQSPPV
jgi:hypothetical protein